jgi:signal transduction histidine kinase
MNQLKNFTLLYVEDNEETLELIKLMLKEKVKTLYTAKDGVDGLRKFKQKNPDIILSDIMMPKMNGIEFSKEIKKINPKVPIVFLTAFNENELLRQSVDIGIDSYITKPVISIESVLQPLGKIAAYLQGEIDAKMIEHMLIVQSKTAAIGEMLSNIAHQWRQPLSVITAISTGLEMKSDFGQLEGYDILPDMHLITTQAQYLSQTIEDFKSFFMNGDAESKKFDLKTTFSKLKTIIESSLHDNSIECYQKLEDVTVYGNENQLIQAILNICNNAKDAMTLNNIAKEKRFLFIKVFEEKGFAKISIKDSGGGIKKDIIDKIFEPYFTTKHQSQGTGIGLYMTLSIVDRQFNGTIDVKNSKYSYKKNSCYGAEFIIKIPMQQD